MPVEAPVKAPTKPEVIPQRPPQHDPDVEPERRLNPDRLCPQQKREIVRRIISE